MEQLLIKIARQLDAVDEASLMALWDIYAEKVQRFEPTKRWEEAALIFSLIQAKRWKNQLFNYQWSTQVRPHSAALETAGFSLERPMLHGEKKEKEPKRANMLNFSNKNKPEPPSE